MSSLATQVRNARRRARKQKLSANLSVEAWQETLEDFDFCCAYCGVYCHAVEEYASIDHYIPIASGGGTCIDNCVPSCPSCNELKAHLLPEQVSHVSGERMEQIRRYLDARRKGKRQPELLHAPVVPRRKREIPMVITQKHQQSEQHLTHGEKITLLSVPQQVFLKLSHSSENLLQAPSYEIGVALTVDECITLARDLLCAAVSPELSSVCNERLYDHAPVEKGKGLEKGTSPH